MNRAGRRIAVSTLPGVDGHLREPSEGSRTLRRSWRAPRLASWLVLTALGLGMAPAACVTSGEGEKMNAQIAELRKRLDDIDKRDADYKEQVARLRKVLDQATALLTRNSADVGAKAAKSEQDIQAIQGRIEELAHNVDLENR